MNCAARPLHCPPTYLHGGEVPDGAAHGLVGDPDEPIGHLTAKRSNARRTQTDGAEHRPTETYNRLGEVTRGGGWGMGGVGRVLIAMHGGKTGA